MTTLATKWPSLLDVAKRTDPDGSIAQIIEILNQVNPILDDAVYVEANEYTGHRTTIRSGISDPTWRKMYGGVQPTKTTTVQVRDSIGMLEDYAEVDKALADLNGNAAAFRLSEDRGHIEGMSQELADTIFYGNEATEPEAFTGLAPRYNSLSAQNALNIVDALGNDTDLTSIYLVVWGPSGVHMIYPKGSKGGLQMEDKGQVTVENVDGSSGRAEMYRTHYRMDAGLCVRDWRQAGRVANIDISANATVTTAKLLVNYMIQLEERIYNLNAGRPVFYCSRQVREYLRLGILNAVSNQLNWETVAGKRVMTFDGIPVHRSDAISATESRVT